MDNFIDKLAQRFNAQEIIKANAQAEAKEMDRLREQIKAYDECLEEMRRLNLKNIEAAEQVRALADQVNNLTRQAITEIGEKKEKEDEHVGQIEAVREEIKAVREETRQAQQEAENARGEMKNVQGEIRNVREETSGIREEVKGIHEEMSIALEEVKSVLARNGELAEESRKKLAAANEGLEDFMHKESVKVYRNVQAVLMEELKNQTEILSGRIDNTIGESKKGNRTLCIFVILTLLASLGSLGVVIAQAFGLM